MESNASAIRTSTIVAISVGTILTGLVGYAVYFDHRRRTDVEFRKSLKRQSKQEAKAQKAQQEASAANARKEIAALVKQMNAEGYPTDTEQKERFFLSNMEEGEKLISSGNTLEGAACLFKTLKVYPAKADLIRMFDQTIPKDVLDILAIMVAQDPSGEDDVDIA